MKIHQIISHTLNSIQYRSLSCFCGIKRGTCNCFGPKTHIFKRTTQNTVILEPTVETEAEMESLEDEILFPEAIFANNDAENLLEARMETLEAEMISAGGSITNNDTKKLLKSEMSSHETKMLFPKASISHNDAENQPEVEMHSLEAKIVPHGQKINDESPVLQNSKFSVFRNKECVLKQK